MEHYIRVYSALVRGLRRAEIGLIVLPAAVLLACETLFDLSAVVRGIGLAAAVTTTILIGARYLSRQEQVGQSLRRVTEDRYRTFVDTIPLGVYHTRPVADSEFLMANPAFVQLLGYESEADLKKVRVPQVYVNPADRARLIGDLIAKGRVAGAELQFMRKDGTPIWGAVTAWLVHDEATGTDYCDCILNDISRYKQIEAALVEGERRYRDLFDHSLNGFALHQVVTNPQGDVIDYIFLEANQAFEDMTGLRATEIIGRRATEVLPGTDLALLTIYGHVAQTGEPARFEQFFAPLNHYYDIAAFSPRRGQFATLFWDITARVQAEMALRESEAQYHELFEGVDDLVVVHDLEGNLLDINDAACRRLGYTRDELLQMTAADIDDPGEYADGFQARLHKQLAQGKLSGFTGAHITKDGRRIDIECTTKVITYHGQLAVLSSAHDITERKRTEEALKQSQAALQSVFRAAPFGIGLLYNRVMHWTNDQFQRMIGYTAEELTNQSTRILYETEEEFRRVGAEKYAQFACGPVGTVETRFLHKDGTLIDILLSSSPLDSSDLSAGVVFAVVDITERKRIEETLYYVAQQSWTLTGDAFFCSLVEYLARTLKVDYALVGELQEEPNTEQTIRTVGYYAVTGLAENVDYALARTPCATVVGHRPQYYSHVTALFPEFPSSLSIIGAECYLGIPLWDSNGKPLGVIAVLDRKPLADPPLAESLMQIVSLRASHELSRRRTEQQVRDSETRYRAIVEDQTELLVRWRPDGTRTFVNDAYCRYYGQPRESLIGVDFFSLVVEEDRQQIRDKLARLTPASPLESDIHRVIKQDGSIGWQEWVDRGFFDDSGHLIEMQSVGRDITERREAEDALREQTELAEALRDITALINSSLDPRRVFDRILTNLIRVVPHDFADIMMIDAGVARVTSFHCSIDADLDEAAMRSLQLPLDATANLRRMAATGQPLIVPDTHEFADWVDIPETRFIRSYMGAPIQVGGETIGFINVNSTQPGFFTDRHVNRLQAFADQAAIAINNAHSYDDLEHRVIERTIDLSVRNAVAETLSNTLEIEPMLNGVLRTTVERIGVHGGAIHLLSDGGTTLSLAACYGISPETLEQVTGFTLGGTNVGMISRASGALNTHPFNIPDETGIYAVLSVPIWRQGQIQGIITLAHNELRPWRAEETRMLDAIGRQIGVALVNARLYSDAIRDEAHIRTILQGVADGLLVFDRHHNLTLMNPAAEALFSFYPEESGGAARAAVLLWEWLRTRDTRTGEPVEFSLPTTAIVPTDEEARCLSINRVHAAAQDPAWPCWLLDGSPNEVDMGRCPVYERVSRRALQAHSAAVQDADEQALGTVIVLHDVTYFRELDELKGRFVSTVSHELRTPLSVVLLQVSTLLKYYDRLPDHQRREMVGEIQQQAHNLRELVEDILELSRFDARRSMPQKQWFDLVSHSDELLGTLEPSIQEKNLHLDVSRNLQSSYLYADPQQVMRVLRNLLGNAIKYTPEGGQITLRLEQTGNEICMSVSDTGIGIAPEEQVYLFDRFFRAEQASRMASGHGLGLSITREIVDLHDGRIELLSTQGEGSTFTVYLPVHRE